MQFYLDNVVVCTNNIDRHIQVLKEALGCLIKAGIKAGPERTELFQNKK